MRVVLSLIHSVLRTTVGTKGLKLLVRWPVGVGKVGLLGSWALGASCCRRVLHVVTSARPETIMKESVMKSPWSSLDLCFPWES